MYTAQSHTKFGANLINNHRAIDDYLNQKRPTCHAYRVNHLWERLKSRYAYRLTIIAQTSCGLKEIALTATESQGKNQTAVNRGVEIL